MDCSQILESDLDPKNQFLCRLFAASCYHQWDNLPEIAQLCYSHGASSTEVRATLRHLIVAAGYGPALKAFNVLHNHQLLLEVTPGKAGGIPGDAFEQVYQENTNKVRRKMHEVDPVLGEYIRTHLYGDIYSSPGLHLKQKQLLMLTFLGVFHMPEQLFGHLLAAFRFGNSLKSCETAIGIGFDQSGCASVKALQDAIETLQQASTVFSCQVSGKLNGEQEVHVPDESSVRIPELPAPYVAEEVMVTSFAWGE